jgi:hypothetical protein
MGIKMFLSVEISVFMCSADNAFKTADNPVILIQFKIFYPF